MATREHAAELTARQVVRQSRKTRGLFSFFRPKQSYKPTYNYQADGSACRVYGTLAIKKVTGECIPSLQQTRAQHVLVSELAHYHFGTWILQL